MIQFKRKPLYNSSNIKAALTSAAFMSWEDSIKIIYQSAYFKKLHYSASQRTELSVALF
ncbi:hypothetical protein MP213Fo_13580 [Pseudochrobactrum sp. MP213Fo]